MDEFDRGKRVCSNNGRLSSFGLFCVVFFTLAGGAAAFNLPTIPFDEGYTPLFGDDNLVRSPDGRAVRLLLNRFTGNTHMCIYIYILFF